MNWKCEIVTDLAPLYYDGMASEASEKLVREHLKSCSDCKTYYKKYRPAEGIRMETPMAEEDFRQLAKQIRKRRLLLWGGFLSYVSMTLAALVLYYVHREK